MRYDIVVVGAGHAGCEAAAAASRMGLNTLIISYSAEDIGKMSCNPSMGGIGKGHILREVDALDGVSAMVADKASIHSKTLNSSKGYAVRGPRAQIDRDLYRKHMSALILSYENITFLADEVIELVISPSNECQGVLTAKNGMIASQATVITTGTFLNGQVFMGRQNIKSGRGCNNANSSSLLSQSLRKAGFAMSRFKTGTTPRITASSINFESVEIQPGSNPPIALSYMTKHIEVPQLNCFITKTNETTHAIVMENLHQSATREFRLQSRSPRYCISIEDKILRFKDRKSHQLFLEPEGLESDAIYVSGLANSFPIPVQERIVRSIAGLERAEIISYGYVIEYDYVNPSQLKQTLEAKTVRGLFLAGQINGTTGYEEAAGQGIISGVNAALLVRRKKQFILQREQSYIGVMIDDLVSKGVDEPYRMFTSRAEFRMSLRSDNAHMRLTKIGYDTGLVSKSRYENLLEVENKCHSLKQKLSSSYVEKDDVEKINKKHDLRLPERRKTKFELLTSNEITKSILASIDPSIASIENEIFDLVDADAKYAPYLLRQSKNVAMIKSMENHGIPDDMNYDLVTNLSSEVKEKLKKIKPTSLGAALRISGVTPASIVNIVAYLRKSSSLSQAANVPRGTLVD